MQWWYKHHDWHSAQKIQIDKSKEKWCYKGLKGFFKCLKTWNTKWLLCNPSFLLPISLPAVSSFFIFPMFGEICSFKLLPQENTRQMLLEEEMTNFGWWLERNHGGKYLRTLIVLPQQSPHRESNACVQLAFFCSLQLVIMMVSHVKEMHKISYKFNFKAIRDIVHLIISITNHRRIESTSLLICNQEGAFIGIQYCCHPTSKSLYENKFLLIKIASLEYFVKSSQICSHVF